MWHRRLSISGLAIFAALQLGCVDTPTQPRPDRTAAQLADSGPIHGSDALFLEVAREVPGFGGVYYDEGGRLNVVVRRQELAAAHPNELVRRLEGSFQVRNLTIPTRDGVQLHEGRYDFVELATWHRRARPALSMNGVVFTHVDHRANRLEIGVEDGVPEERLERMLSQLDVPREAVTIRRTDPITLYSGHTLQNVVRPVAGGLQIHFDVFLCTFGFNVIRADGPHWITNSHCSTERGLIGTSYFQPIALDGVETFIGVEVEDPPFFIAGPCPLGRLCRFSDAAVAMAADVTGATFKQGAIYRTRGGPGSLEIDFDRRQGEFFRIVNDDPTTAMGQRLHKVGRTTGWTESTVTSACANVNVSDTQITMLCQALVEGPERIGGPGDSGSPFFRRIPERAGPNSPHNDVALHGILWGGNAPGTLIVFSPIQNLRQELTPFSAVATDDF